MRSKQKTLERFRADMARLRRAVKALPAEQQQIAVYGAWTAKDLLGHIAAWDRWLCGAIDELLAGQRPRFGRTSVFNKRAVDASHALSYADVLQGMRRAHQVLMSRIEALSDEEWKRPSPYRWGNRTPMTVDSLFDYTYKGETHYGGHAKEIESWEAKRA